MEKLLWNDRYKTNDYYYGGKPNVFFKQFIDMTKPGKLLLPCEGEGRNAVYAAVKGWDVTAFDFSETAVEKALKLAKLNKVSIKYFVKDIKSFNYSDYTDYFDVIGVIFAHFKTKERVLFHRNLTGCLNNGGIIVLECFNKNQIGNIKNGGPKDVDMLYSKEILEKDFDNINIVMLEEKSVMLDEGVGHKGKCNVIRMIAYK